MIENWEQSQAPAQMPRTIYCWRCRMDLPMLTEEEWAIVSPQLANGVAQVKAYRQKHGCSLAEATSKGFGQQALREYERITGFKGTNPNALFHHRLSLYGPPCHVCGKPLRTPQARYCAMCSSERKPGFNEFDWDESFNYKAERSRE